MRWQNLPVQPSSVNKESKALRTATLFTGKSDPLIIKTNRGFSHCASKLFFFFKKKIIQSLIQKIINKKCCLESKNKTRNVGKRTKIIGSPGAGPWHRLYLWTLHLLHWTKGLTFHIMTAIRRKATTVGNISVWVVVKTSHTLVCRSLTESRCPEKKGSSSAVPVRWWYSG